MNKFILPENVPIAICGIAIDARTNNHPFHNRFVPKKSERNDY